MRNTNKASITDAVVASISKSEDPRTKEIMTAAIRHLHAFVREVKLTTEEWQLAMDMLLKTAKVTDDERNEFIIFSDTLGVSSLVDLIREDAGEGTEASLLGPFYIPGSPELGYGADMLKDNDGMPAIVTGKIVDLEGNPISGAVLDIWQGAANGFYQIQDPNQNNENLRGRTVSNEDGEYLFATIKPVPYPIPDDGPVGEMLRATNRSNLRTSHIHFKITAEGFKPLVTQVFSDDDPYLDQDAVFGVRESLITKFEEASASDVPPIAGVKAPYCKVTFDFSLAPE